MNGEKKSIVICSNTSWYLYNFRGALIKNLIREGYDVSLIAPVDEYTESLESWGCKHYHVDMNNQGANPFEDIKLIYQYIKLLRRIRPDTLLIYTIKPNIYASFASKILNILTINVIAGLGTIFLTDNFQTRIARSLYKMALSGNRVIFENADDSREFVKMGVIEQKQSIVIPGSGVDTNIFKPRNLFPNRNKITFLMIARLIKDKGILEYIEAIKIIKEKYKNVEFKILGSYYFDNPSAISEEELKSWIDSGLIEYRGYTDNVMREIDRVDCIVLPSYREGLSKVLLEAGSMAKPIITTNVTGCREVVDDGYNGFLVQPKSGKSLAKAIEKMINLPYQDRIEMGIRGRIKVIDEFDEKIVIKKYMRAINLSENKKLALNIYIE